MISRTKLITYTGTVLRSAQKNLAAFGKGRQATTLHRLRVAIKKMKSLEYLNSFHPDNTNPAFTSILIGMNKDAGRIRSLDINLELVGKSEPPDSSLMRKLKKERKSEADTFASRIPYYKGELNRFRKLFIASFRELSDESITGAFRELKSDIKKDLHHRKNPDKNHHARKNVKSLIYLNGILTPEIKNTIHLNQEYLDKLQHTIGQWHDAVVTLKDIKAYGKIRERTKNKITETEKKKSAEVKSLTKRFSEKATDES